MPRRHRRIHFSSIRRMIADVQDTAKVGLEAAVARTYSQAGVLLGCIWPWAWKRRKPERPRSESRTHRVGVIWHRTDSAGKSAPGLGPPRSARRRRIRGLLLRHWRFMPIARIGIAHPTGWRSGFPTGRPWDFAVPDPRHGSSALRRQLPGGYEAGWVRRTGCRGTLSPRAGASRAATLTRLACSAFFGAD